MLPDPNARPQRVDHQPGETIERLRDVAAAAGVAYQPVGTGWSLPRPGWKSLALGAVGLIIPILVVALAPSREPEPEPEPSQVTREPVTPRWRMKLNAHPPAAVTVDGVPCGNTPLDLDLGSRERVVLVLTVANQSRVYPLERPEASPTERVSIQLTNPHRIERTSLRRIP